MIRSDRRSIILRATAQAELVRIKCDIPRTAPIDPIHVSESRGCEVRLLDLPSLEGVYSPTPSPVIVLGSDRPAGRRAFTCAHELGHHEFKHGTRIEKFNPANSDTTRDHNEVLADMFAATLLMPQGGIRRALRDRDIQPLKVQPMQILQLSSYFGVGYATLIEHITWTLKILSPNQREKLLRIQPRQLKAEFGGTPQSEVIFADNLWRDRAVDLEIGDILVLPKTASILDNGCHLVSHGNVNGRATYQAVTRGYLRAFHAISDWAVNIRVAAKHFQGLARYRFLEDPEESTNDFP